MNKKQWVLASNNQGKLAELQQLFNKNALDVELIPQAKLNIDDAIEDGLSFVENAIIKARALRTDFKSRSRHLFRSLCWRNGQKQTRFSQ